MLICCSLVASYAADSRRQVVIMDLFSIINGIFASKIWQCGVKALF